MLESHPQPPGFPRIEFYGVFLNLRTPKVHFVTAFGCWLYREPPPGPGKDDSTTLALPPLSRPGDRRGRRCR